MSEWALISVGILIGFVFGSFFTVVALAWGEKQQIRMRLDVEKKRQEDRNKYLRSGERIL